MDPGTRLCGYAVVARHGSQLLHVDNGVIVLDERLPLAERLRLLFGRLEAVIAELKPKTAAVEGIFQHQNARSALVLGHARGVALLASARAGLTVAEYTPQQIKKAVTGTGRAEKAQVAQMVTLRLGLPDVPQADAADAVAVAMCHAQHLMETPPTQEAAHALPPPLKRGGRAALTAWVKSQEGKR